MDLPYTVSNDNYNNTKENFHYEEFFDFNKNKQYEIDGSNSNLVNQIKTKDVLIYKSVQPMQLPLIYSGLMTFVIGYMILLFLPPFYTVATKSYLYVNKFNVYHFSEHLYRSNIMVKLVVLIAAMFFSSITFNLFFLIRQRIAVPELHKYRIYNKIFLFLSFFINFGIILLTFFYYPVIDFTENKLGLCDNIVFFIVMAISYFYCVFSLDLIKGIKVGSCSININVLKLKKILVDSLFWVIISCKII
jgi:hypothetical protein